MKTIVLPAVAALVLWAAVPAAEGWAQATRPQTRPHVPTAKPAAAQRAAAVRTTPARPVAARPGAKRPTAARPAPAKRTTFRPQAAPRRAYVPPPPVIDIDPGAQVAGNPPTVLDSADVARYQRIIAAQASSDWTAADTDIGALRDKVLVGYVLAQRYLSSGYAASYDQLADWLRDYGDHPDAPNIYKAALARRPAGAPEPQAATFATASRSIAPDARMMGGESVQAASIRSRLARMIEDRGFSAARLVLDLPDTQRALPPDEVQRWRAEIGSRQVESGGEDQPIVQDYDDRPSAAFQAGIAAWRQGAFSEAARQFERVAETPGDRAYSATIAAGAFWAARANLAAGSPERFALWMKRAAIYDRTFYGLIALRTLGVEVRPQWKAAELNSTRRSLLRDDRTARRGLALLQLKAVSNAEVELNAAALDADPRMVEAVLALAEEAKLPSLALKVATQARERPEKIEGLDNALYPIPPYTPREGFSVDRALVFAVMRQESAFNPRARSWAGAMGLMQLMPGTAAQMERQSMPDRIGTDRYDPSHNVSLGQSYLQTLLDDYANNLMQVVPAYNAGPGNVNRWLAAADLANDPLLFAASIPINETRGYLESVMANYWIYRMRLGQRAESLDQVAQAQWPTHTARDARR
ncbi:lytic transglycosylase domain-containing protein [Vineibacter terrae]|uniref:Lytic transglycosylase domain-containing protein n=1 Tax=Vineibacter terrae TaxID=2586908 RepID=A0A5C8PRS5_9HYPH|nr:lytic transglycosylase domain-containing protein [Vineibacter terrae]TXL78108.1 lytic transglycosylase domain-containing protein [Vineibacter terrae]